jgi:hypothetical protein
MVCVLIALHEESSKLSRCLCKSSGTKIVRDVTCDDVPGGM